MILLDENHNASLLLWFRSLLCVFWQSLRSNSVSPSCVFPPIQNSNTLYILKKKNQLDKITHLSKGIVMSITYGYTLSFILNRRQLLFKFQFNKHPPFSQNISLRSILRVWSSLLYDKHTVFFKLIFSFRDV